MVICGRLIYSGWLSPIDDDIIMCVSGIIVWRGIIVLVTDIIIIIQCVNSVLWFIDQNDIGIQLWPGITFPIPWLPLYYYYSWPIDNVLLLWYVLISC